MIGPTYPFRGGISHYTTFLYQHLKKKHDVELFSFKRQYPMWLYPGKTDRDPSKRPIEAIGEKKCFDVLNPLSWMIIAHKINQNKPDVLIIPWWVSFFGPPFGLISFLIRHFSKTKIMFICHNVHGHEATSIDDWVTHFVLRNAHACIVHSTEDERLLRLMCKDVQIYKTAHPNYRGFVVHQKSPYRFTSRPIKRLLFFGYVRQYKGLMYLLEALPEVLSKQEVQLFIVGEFWKDKTEYLRKIEHLGIQNHVVIIDRYVPNEDIPMYFESADVVVQPYISGTGSGVVQMAFAFNTPVVATTVGDLKEVISHGKTGFLVPPKNPQALAQAILDSLTEENQKKIRANIMNENDTCSWEKLGNIIEEFILN